MVTCQRSIKVDGNIRKTIKSINGYEDRLEQLQEDKSFLKEELEVQVNDLPDNYITAKRKPREEYNPRIQQVNDEILDVKGKIGDLKVGLVETGVDVGRDLSWNI